MFQANRSHDLPEVRGIRRSVQGRIGLPERHLVDWLDKVNVVTEPP
jgi:hypothetical protein